jgi:hypothetical protein
MKKAIPVAAFVLVTAVGFAGKATAQVPQYRTEVCVNESLVDDAKRLFPNASVHVLPDSSLGRPAGGLSLGISARMEGFIATKKSFKSGDVSRNIVTGGSASGKSGLGWMLKSSARSMRSIWMTGRGVAPGPAEIDRKPN